MDRCALFVDAGYVLADGAMAVHGTRRRESVSWDYAGLLQLFGSLAAERTGLPLLRCYWYEATVEGRRSAEHDMLADLPGVKLRLAKMRPGHREGVESEIHRDLTTLARNKAVSDVMVVSAEEDLAQVIADVQDMGMRVTLLHIVPDGADGDGTVPRALRQECDDVVEVSAGHLRPYVELISGAEPPRQEKPDAAASAPHPVANANGHSANGHSVSAANGHAATVVAAETAQPEPGKQERAERADGATAPEYAPAADFGAGVDYGASVDYGAPADYAPAAVHQAPPDQGPGIDYRSALDYGAPDFNPVPDYAVPLAAPTMAAREERPRLAADFPPYQPAPESAQVRRLPTRGPAPAGPNFEPPPPGAAPGSVPGMPGLPPPPPMAQPAMAQPATALPPGPHQLGGQPPAGQQPGGQLPSGQPTGAQPALPVAPVVSLDSNGTGGYGAARGGPRQVIPGPGGPGGPVGSQPPPLGPPVPGGQNAQAGPGGLQAGPPEAPSGPIGLVGPGGYPGGVPGVSLGDAVQSAHEEGQAFGESVARDAPALWLEAVLARKPRMPSDLEARLLQGSTLPIDFLLHDEVRHALRRGFWDALERARR